MNRAVKPVLILHAGNPDDALVARFGSYADQLRRAAGLHSGDVRVVAVYLGETPRPPGHYRAALITGAPAIVTDRAPWSEHTAAWLRRAANHGLPVFGVCCGRQLLAQAFGGRVDYNPAGREVGTRMIEWLPAETDADPATDALAAGLPATFLAQTMHSLTVLEPPPGARVLARSALDGVHAMRVAPRVMSTQFHPEFSADFVRAHLAHYGERYARKGLDPAALLREVRDTPVAATFIQRFLRAHGAAGAAIAKNGVPGGTVPAILDADQLPGATAPPKPE